MITRSSLILDPSCTRQLILDQQLETRLAFQSNRTPESFPARLTQVSLYFICRNYYFNLVHLRPKIVCHSCRLTDFFERLLRASFA